MQIKTHNAAYYIVDISPLAIRFVSLGNVNEFG